MRRPGLHDRVLSPVPNHNNTPALSLRAPPDRPEGLSAKQPSSPPTNLAFTLADSD